MRQTTEVWWILWLNFNAHYMFAMKEWCFQTSFPLSSSVKVFFLASVHIPPRFPQCSLWLHLGSNEVTCHTCMILPCEKHDYWFWCGAKLSKILSWGNWVQYSKIFIFCWYVSLHMASVTWLLKRVMFLWMLVAVMLKESCLSGSWS